MLWHLLGFRQGINRVYVDKPVTPVGFGNLWRTLNFRE